MPSSDNVDGAFCWRDGDSTSIIISVIVDTSGLGIIESERLAKFEVKFEFSPVEFETSFRIFIGTTSRVSSESDF